ncbi:MAG: hypothetical protein IKV57_06100 [Clostridia bacterium]|nr:hypothetical protein [Clostridia bacterium]
MFVIRPVEDKGVQEELCGVCGCSYIAEDFAYFAANITPDGAKLLGILGICQFAFKNDCGIVHNLQPMPGTFDEEVMIIMIRTAMEFVHRCGGKTMVLAEGACDAAFAKQIGFRLTDGEYRIDLEAFYRSPCSYQAKLAQSHEE